LPCPFDVLVTELFNDQSQMSFLFENIHFENDFRDGRYQRDGQAQPLNSVLSLIVYDDFLLVGGDVFFYNY